MAIRFTNRCGVYGHQVYETFVVAKDVLGRDQEYKCRLIAKRGFEGDRDGTLSIEGNRCTFSAHMPLEALQALRVLLVRAVPVEPTVTEE